MLRILLRTFPVLLVLLCATELFAAARIVGIVTDKDTKEPIAGVNIMIKGTYHGAASDLEGSFMIAGVQPGNHELRATSLGYKVFLRTGIKVRDDETITVNIEMEPTVLALGQEVVVYGKKPLLNIDETATNRTVSSSEIQDMVVEDVNDILSQQVGVVRTNNEIHIRGGRADENLYIIDNLAVKDPISGEGLGIYLSADAIQELEVITGGFNAEYGQAMSGLINVETKEGGEKYSGSLSFKTDNLGGFPNGHQNTGNMEFSLGGPEPITEKVLKNAGADVPGEVSFFLNGYGYASDTYLPTTGVDLQPYKSEYDNFAPRVENNWSALGKLTWKPTPIFKASYSYGRSLRINQGYFDALVEDKEYYPLEYMDILDRYNTFTREGLQQTFNLVHTLNKSTFYELTVGNFYNRVHSGQGDKHWTEYKEPVDIDPIYYDVDENGEVVVSYGDGLWDDGNSSTYHDHFNDTWQVKFHLTSKALDRREIKFGIEYEQTLLQLFTIHDPWIASTDFGGDYDMYHVTTEAGAIFLQENVEFKGLIANIGLRFDWWSPGQYVDDAINDPNVITISDAARQQYLDDTTEILGRRMKYHLSPRLGISHPVTDSDMLFFSYGHFSQRPKYAYVYSKLKAYSPSTFQLFGNPNLNPQTTVAYEMGVKHRFPGDQVIELVAFYKDLFDYATSFKVNSTNPRLGTVSFYQYFNVDYARVRGIEMRFRARQGKYLTGNADFSYSIATGKSSSANAEIQAAADTRVAEKTLGEEFLSWDKPITASFTLWLRIPKGDHPQVLGLRLPSNWGGSIRFDIQSGKRYTPGKLTNEGQDIQDDGERYSEISGIWNTVDMKLYKQWEVAGLSVNAFVEAQNIFDFKKPNQINPLTGEPYETGDPYPRSWENPQGFVLVDPGRWQAPRQVYFGLGFRF